MYLGRVRWVTLGSAATIAHENWAQYSTLSVPLLAVHGTADANTAPSGSSDLIDVISSPDKTLVLVDGGKHAILDDTDRDRTTDDVLEWLGDRVETPAADSPGR